MNKTTKHNTSRVEVNKPNFWLRRTMALGMTGILGLGVAESPIGQGVTEVGRLTSAAFSGADRYVLGQLRDDSKVKIPPTDQLPVEVTAQPYEGPEQIIRRTEPKILGDAERAYEVEQIIRSEIPADQNGVIHTGDVFHLPKK
jgi:hypothetical protein